MFLFKYNYYGINKFHYFTISGPFFPSLDRAKTVDFSRPYWPSYHAVVVPLQFDSKMWYIIDPFQFHVWILFIASIPIYLTAMGLTDYVYHGLVNWDDIGGHLIRNVLSENNFRLPDRKQGHDF